jgi:hypothetical protein
MSACTDKLVVLEPRQNLRSIPQDSSPQEIPGGGLVLEEDIYSPAKFMSACTWLDTLASKTRDEEQGFRILEDYGVKTEGSGWKGPFGDDSRLPFFRRKKKDDDAGRENLDLASLYGRVQLNDNPLYEYGLVQNNGSIPTREEFLKLVDAEIFKSPIKILPLIAARAAMGLGFPIDPYKKRNEIIQDTKIGAALPGVYDTQGQLYALKDTFPDVLVQNGAPYAEILKPLPNDSVQESEKKAIEIKKVLGVLSKRLPMFRERNWAAFRDDMRWGLSAAIRGMQSTNPIEQACAAAIFHRGFAQMLSVKGYDRPPLQHAKTERGSRWVLLGIDRFLENPRGTRLRACPGVGSFTRDGRSTQVKDDELADTSGASRLTLASEPQPVRSCLEENARVLQVGKQPTVWGMKRPDMKAANLEQKLEFMAGVSYFLMAFSPGSKWWFGDKVLVAYPLSDFGAEKTTKDILASGGLLPYEAFALSLGFLNLAGNNLIDQHLVYVDKRGVETTGDGDVLGVRISTSPRQAFAPGPVVTDIHSVLLLTDVVFKLHETLAKMADWVQGTERQLAEEVRKNPDSPDTKRMQQDFDTFVKGLFGSRETLVMLTETGDDSIRKQVDDFRLALSLLLARFVKPDPLQNAAGKKIYSCYAQLKLDPVTGVEEQLGSCDSKTTQGLQSQTELFRQSMRLVGRAFRSPLYLEYGQEP